MTQRAHIHKQPTRTHSPKEGRGHMAPHQTDIGRQTGMRGSKRLHESPVLVALAHPCNGMQKPQRGPNSDESGPAPRPAKSAVNLHNVTAQHVEKGVAVPAVLGTPHSPLTAQPAGQVPKEKQGPGSNSSQSVKHPPHHHRPCLPGCHTATLARQDNGNEKGKRTCRHMRNEECPRVGDG